MYESEKSDDEWREITETLMKKAQQENNLWQAEGISQSMLQINAYLIQIKVNTLIEVIKRLGVSEAEIEAIFQDELLKQLEVDRKMLLKAKKKAKSSIMPAPNRLLGPNGTPL